MKERLRGSRVGKDRPVPGDAAVADDAECTRQGCRRTRQDLAWLTTRVRGVLAPRLRKDLASDERSGLPLGRRLQLVGLGGSTFYYRAKPNEKRLDLVALIGDWISATPELGRRRIHGRLVEAGHQVSLSQAGRLLEEARDALEKRLLDGPEEEAALAPVPGGTAHRAIAALVAPLRAKVNELVEENARLAGALSQAERMIAYLQAAVVTERAEAEQRGRQTMLDSLHAIERHNLKDPATLVKLDQLEARLERANACLQEALSAQRKAEAGASKLEAEVKMIKKGVANHG